MGIDVRLENSKGEALESMLDPHSYLPRILKRIDESEHLLINGIDFYGDTVFNRLQAPRLIGEWQRLVRLSSSDEERVFLETVLRLIERCQDEVHRYLKFIGD